MKKYYKKFIGMLGMFGILGMFLMNATTVWAGSINGAEASVISAASGEFTYKGATYRAYDSYISQLSEYMARDDVNLSQADAQDLIATIKGSVADGVSNGYLYKVSGTESDESSSKSADAADNPNKDNSDSSANQPKKKFNIEKAIKNNKIFYKTQDSSTSVDMVIKNTGFSITNSIYTMIGLAVLMMGAIVVAIRFDLFAHESES